MASILLAFAIDAWWESKKQATQEQVILRQLQSELHTNMGILAEQRRLHSETLEATVRLLANTGPQPNLDNIDADQVLKDFAAVQDWWTIDLQIGVVTALVQSGDLGLIDSNELRNSIAVWPTRVQDLIAEEDVAKQFVQNVVLHYLIRNASLRKIQNHPDVGPGNFPIELADLLSDREFDNILSERLFGVRSILEDLDGLMLSLNEILSLIDASLT